MPATAAAQLGLQLAGEAAGAGMGMILGGINDRRQIRQQEKLQAMQIAGQKEMGDYNYRKQKQMWEETNYPGQIEQMKKAGLNPGMIYGMSGGGGTSTGSQGGNVSGASAPQGGHEITEMAGMGLQSAMNLKLLQAQTENIQAQTENTKTDTAKKAGVDTEAGKQSIAESQTRIDALLQGIDNAKQQNEIQKLEITLKHIENWEKQASQEDRLHYIEYQTKQAMKQLQIVSNEAYMSSKTMKDKIAIIAQTAIGAALQNTQTKAQTEKIKSDIEVNKQGIEQSKSNIRVNEQQINNFIQNNMREWDKMSQTNKEIAIKQMLGEYNSDPVNTMNVMKIMDNILKFVP